MTIQLIHLCSLASNSQSPLYPAGFDRRTLAAGTYAWVMWAARVRMQCPTATHFLIDDPWGKHWYDGRWSTLFDQRARAEAMGNPVARMADWEAVRTAFEDIRSFDLEPEIKIGFIPQGMNIHAIVKEIGMLSHLGVQVYVDGLEGRPSLFYWLPELCRVWGLKPIGVEANPDPGSTWDRPEHPSLFNASTHPRVTRNQGTMIWRGSGTPADGTAADAVRLCRERGYRLAMHLAPVPEDKRGLQDLSDVLGAIESTEGTVTNGNV